MASRLEFAAMHLANLQGFLDGRFTVTQLEQGANILQGLTQMLQARNSLNANKSMAEWMCTSIDSGGGQVFKFPKGGQQPDTMTSALFASITTDPM